jgi:Zn-dependent protease with chaperone function
MTDTTPPPRRGPRQTARRALAALLALALAGCAPPPPAPRLPPEPSGRPAPPPAAALPEAPPGGRLDTASAARLFVAVVEDVRPAAEAHCRELRRDLDCAFRIVIDGRPGQPPNAFFTLDELGRPVIAFTLALIADVRNGDELAFILGHEAGHHIAGHIPRTEANAISGAVLLGTLATLSGAGAAEIRAAERIGAAVGARSFSREFELEADAIGTVIAFRAGYDPARGAAFFDRIPDPGNAFLGTHPPNDSRRAVVASTLARLRGY